MTCEVRNLSTLGSTEFASVSAAFQDELQRRGAKLVLSEASFALTLHVTQTPAEYVGVVQIQRKDNPETLLESLGPVKGRTDSTPAFSLELHRELLFSQENPILDVVLDESNSRAYALGTQEITIYELRDDRWTATSSAQLPRHRAPGRAARGYLGFGIDMESAQFPGETCSIYFSPASKGWSCEKNSHEVRVNNLAPEEALAGKKTGPWLSLAQFNTDGRPKLVVTGEDGLARLYESGGEPLAIFPGWGGEIATVQSACGTGWQLLVTGSGDWTKADVVQAVEIRERRAVPLSAALDFPGAISALHTPGAIHAPGTTGNDRALAVDWNLQTGRYEAYLLSITCAH